MAQNSGFGLIEIIIAAAIISTALFSLSYVFILADRLVLEASDKSRAAYLSEEGLEALRYLRDDSWSRNIATLSAGNIYYVSFSTSTFKWNVVSSNPGLLDNFYARIVTIENVQRDGSDNIVSSGGTNDPNTKKLNVQVSWSERGAQASTTLSTYLTNLFQN